MKYSNKHNKLMKEAASFYGLFPAQLKRMYSVLSKTEKKAFRKVLRDQIKEARVEMLDYYGPLRRR